MHRNSPARPNLVNIRIGSQESAVAVTELTAELTVCVTLSLRFDLSNDAHSTLSRNPSDAGIPRQSSPKLLTAHRSSSSARTDRSESISSNPTDSEHVVKGLRPAIDIGRSTTSVENISKYIVSCHTSLQCGSQNDDHIIGFILKKKNQSVFTAPSKIEIGIPDDDCDIAMTESRWMYILFLSQGKIHLCAIDFDGAALAAICFVADNIRRLKQEAKISMNWPHCNILVRVTEQAAPHLITWICKGFHSQIDKIENTKRNNSLMTLPLPAALAVHTVGTPHPGLIRQDLTFSISPVKSYLANQINLKGSHVTVEKFFAGYGKRLEKRKTDKVLLYKEIMVRYWDVNNIKQIPKWEEDHAISSPACALSPRRRRKSKMEDILVDYRFDKFKVAVQGFDIASAPRNEPCNTILARSLAKIV